MGQVVGCICGQDTNLINPKNDVTVENLEIIENSGMNASLCAGENNNEDNNVNYNNDDLNENDNNENGENENIENNNEDDNNENLQLKSQNINNNKIKENSIEDEFNINLDKIGKLIPNEENNSELNKYTNKKIIKIKKNLSEFDSSEQNKYLNTIIKEAYKFDNNIIYKGSWNINNYKKEGFGILIDEEGNKYIGYFQDDLMNGKGRLFNKEGDYFEGNFEKGDFKEGKLILKSGYKLEGVFINGKINGKGKESLDNIFNYEGNFENGKRNGEGIYKWEDGSIYKGNFINGEINGKGNFKWNDGRNYNGDFKNGIIEGKGEFSWPNGKKYIGEYKFNKKNGAGKYYWDNNIYYDGDWVNNQQHGKGIFYENENKIKGIFRYGKLIKIEEGNLNNDNNDNGKDNNDNNDNNNNKEKEKKDIIHKKVEEENVIKLKKIEVPKENKNIKNPMNMMIKNKLGNKKKENKKNGANDLKRNVSVVPERESGDDDSGNADED